MYLFLILTLDEYDVLEQCRFEHIVLIIRRDKLCQYNLW